MAKAISALTLAALMALATATAALAEPPVREGPPGPPEWSQSANGLSAHACAPDDTAVPTLRNPNCTGGGW